MELKFGMPVRFRAAGRTTETMTIARWNRRYNGQREPGWHLVRFADGGLVVINERDIKAAQ